MFESILDKPIPLRRKGLIVPDLVFSTTQLLSTSQRVIKYHQSHPWHIPNSNLLSLLVDQIPYTKGDSMDVTIGSTVRVFNERAFSYGLVTDRSKGFTHIGNIYGNIPELFVIDTSTDVPLKVLRHPFVNTDLPQLNGAEEYELDKERTFISVFALNPRELARVYHSWRIVNDARPIEEQESSADFICRHVLSHMFTSHIKNSLLNMFVSRLTGSEFLEIRGHMPLAMTDYTHKLEDAYDELVEELINKDYALDGLLEELDLGKDISLIDYKALTSIQRNTKTYWAVFLANYRIFYIWLFYLGIVGKGKDQSALHRFEKDLLYIGKNRAFRTDLTDEDEAALTGNYEVLAKVLKTL